MNSEMVIGASEGLEFLVRQKVLPDGGEELTFSTARGSRAVVVLGSQDGHFVFSHGKGQWVHVASPGFVDEVAAWLGFEMVAGEAKVPVERPTLSWVLLGAGRDRLGVPWQRFKLFLSGGERYAELFLHLTPDRLRGRLHEKWSEYRVALLELLEGASGATPGRVPRKAAQVAEEPRELVGFRGGYFEVDPPAGWTTRKAEEGQWQFVDAGEDAMFELSTTPLPLLPPDAPTLQDRVEAALRGTPGQRGGAIQTLERDGLQFAWGDHVFDSHDTKDPNGPPRLAVSRVLICANELEQALVTSVWWKGDEARVEPEWRKLRDSFRYDRASALGARPTRG